MAQRKEVYYSKDIKLAWKWSELSFSGVAAVQMCVWNRGTSMCVCILGSLGSLS